MDTIIHITSDEKYNPKNSMEAWFFQIVDDVRILRALAAMNDKKGYNDRVDFIIERLKQAKQ